MARDRIEERHFKATPPDDGDDPFRFGQAVESLKDAMILELRRLMTRSRQNAGTIREQPTIRKYSIDERSGSSPYDTFVQLHQDHPDTFERLPIVAVTSVSGTLKRDSIGRSFTGHIQHPPRVQTTPGPFTLAAPVVEEWTFEVTGGDVSVSAFGVTWTVEDQGSPSATAAILAADAPVALREAVGVTVSGAVVRLRGLEPGVPFVVSGTGGTALQVQAASSAEDYDELTLALSYGDPSAPSSVRFCRVRFQTGGNVPASTLASFIEEQVGGVKTVVREDDSLQIRTNAYGPNGIEVRYSAASLAFCDAAGLCETGPCAVGDSFVSNTLTVAGADFTGLEGRNVTLVGPSGEPWGVFPIVSVDGTGVLSVSNAALGDQADLDGWTWFVGQKDDTNNPLRPIMNRYQTRMDATIQIEVFASSANERRELADIVGTLFDFVLEDRHHVLHGRGAFDPETYPSEIWKAGLGAQISNQGRQEFPRPGSEQQKVHSLRYSIPWAIWQYIDRPLQWTTGPKAGQQQVLESVYDPTLPGTCNFSDDVSS
jgi:hypothetical protein